MEIVNVEQRSESWFKLRRQKLGASNSGPILGLSPYETSYDVWLSKQPEYIDKDNPAMRQGREREPDALRMFELETGHLMSPIVGISDLTSFVMASFDGYEIDGKCAVELKCPYSDKAHLEAIHGQIPKHYYSQMQHQMYVAELQEVYFCSYRPEHKVKPLYIEIIKRDESFIEKMIEKEIDFYFNHMLTGIPPLNPKTEPKIIELESWKLLSDEYKRLDFQHKEAEQRKNEIKDLLLQISGAQNAKGNGIILQKIERKGIIDYKNIPELKKVDTEKYRKPGSSYWQVKDDE